MKHHDRSHKHNKHHHRNKHHKGEDEALEKKLRKRAKKYNDAEGDGVNEYDSKLLLGDATGSLGNEGDLI